MDLTHTEERTALKDSVRAWAAREWPPAVVRELQGSATGFDPRRWKQVRDLGWTGIAVPESAGGLGGDLLDLVVVVEELGRAAVSLPLAATVAHGILPLMWAGDPGGRLGGLFAGETVAVPAEVEPDGRASWPRSAAAGGAGSGAAGGGGGGGGGGGWRVSGTKTLVPFAEAADLLMVTTRLDGPGDAVVAIPTGRDGLSWRRLHLPVGDPVYRVELDRVLIRPDDVVASGGRARDLHTRMGAAATLLSCAYAVGLCATALDLAVEHARDRVQFGRPIGAFQSVANRCADMRVQTDAFRWLTYEAAWRFDRPAPVEQTDRTDQADRARDDAYLAVATAKSYGDLTVSTVCRDAHQVLAGMGVSTEHDLHLFTRRARTFEQTGGGPTRHLHRVADLIGL
jgi:alkylation response protein AidB-like acyl-CoA dehydrogenase